MNALTWVYPGWGVAGAAAGIVILLLSLRRGRPSESAYVDLWRRALAEAGWIERLSRWFPGAAAWFAAVGVALAGAALATPMREEAQPRDLCIAIDCSASMAARDGGDLSRIEAARRAIAGILDGAAPGDRFCMVAVGSRLLESGALSASRAEWARALAAIEVEPRASDLSSALRALEGLGMEVVLASDFAGAKRETAAKLPTWTGAGAAAIAVGSDAYNTGILDLSVDDPFPEDRVIMNIRLATDSSEAVRVAIACEGGGARKTFAPETVRRNEHRPVRLEMPRGRGGLFTIRIEPGGALALDDTVSFYVETPASSPIVYVRRPAGGSRFLEAALNALAAEFKVPMYTAESAADAPKGSIVFQDGGRLDGDPARAVLFGVECAGLAAPAADHNISEIIKIAPGQFATRGLSFESLLSRRSVVFERAFESDRGRFTPLVESGAGSVVGLEAQGGSGAVARRRLWCAFELENSNLPVLSATFPVFMRRAFAWCAKDSIEAPSFVKSSADPWLTAKGAPPAGTGRVGEVSIGPYRTWSNFLEPQLVPVKAGRSPLPANLPARATRRVTYASLPALASALAFAIAMVLEAAALLQRHGRRRGDGAAQLPTAVPAR
jgi:hypothetical protein